MLKIFDIIQINNRAVLITTIEQIQNDRFLLKGLLIGNGDTRPDNKDNWSIAPTDLFENALDNFPCVLLWEEPVFLTHPGSHQKIDSLSDQGKLNLLKAYQNFSNNKHIFDIDKNSINKKQKSFNIHLIKERLTVAKLSFPAKKLAYELSDEHDWECHEKAYIKALNKTLRQLQTQHC